MKNYKKNSPKGHQEMDDLANRFFGAIEQADFDALEKLYSPDVVYWMNAMPHTQNLEMLLNLARLFHQKINNLQYEVESREFFEGGFVQRSIIKGDLASGESGEQGEQGESFAVPICLIIYVENGQIVRLFEYINPAPLMPVFA